MSNEFEAAFRGVAHVSVSGAVYVAAYFLAERKRRSAEVVVFLAPPPNITPLGRLSVL